MFGRNVTLDAPVKAIYSCLFLDLICSNSFAEISPTSGRNISVLLQKQSNRWHTIKPVHVAIVGFEFRLDDWRNDQVTCKTCKRKNLSISVNSHSILFLFICYLKMYKILAFRLTWIWIWSKNWQDLHDCLNRHTVTMFVIFYFVASFKNSTMKSSKAKILMKTAPKLLLLYAEQRSSLQVLQKLGTNSEDLAFFLNETVI